MTKPRSRTAEALCQIVRRAEGPKYFGLSPNALDQAIKDGKVPRPFPLVDGGRALGWTVQQIVDHQRQRQAALADKQADQKKK